ncbi:uncharacterized protein LACBIDRAFT_294056 [Laccaria bicolor S238N-H82]|uniref:Predicted protein n=1 Tax=Laccaria bicolor (strain S238N-H82 / ATCC MYA-4686) TaxID=486041 RepID=B0D8S7_LACBS|nr:uncharacterized protein LACBIDRAFT_294056 [Laccaria bicolor S238N-H82]EDR09125.1 predicted protein [Laccaria bicolor S238N-H82]|eukprot:XP_001880438.1 predicted protein [Laccaria bicolor S238N-H82]
MLRSQLLRLTARPIIYLPKPTRQYATAPGPLPGQAELKQKAKGSDNTLVYIALGLAAAGGAYFYFNNPQDTNAKANREQIKQKGVETTEATKSSDDAYRQAKAQGQSKIDSARSNIDDVAGDVATRAQGLEENAEAKYSTVRDSTKESLAKARGSTENLYKEARTATGQTAERLSAEAGKEEEKIKRGWFSWLGGGSSKAEKGKEKSE